MRDFLHFGALIMPARPILPDSIDDLTEDGILTIINVAAEVMEK